MTSSKQVSFEDELLIVVNDNDEELGYKSKTECHDEGGILHRAFSIFIFNEKMQLLIQKRSRQKRLWPLFWSNSCCSHPRKGEEVESAVQRRLKEEVGLSASVNFLFKFQYFAKYKDIGSELEVCSVFAGISENPVTVNQNEIDEWKYIDIPELEENMEKNQNRFSPWLKLEWQKIKKFHFFTIKSMVSKKTV